MDSLVQPLVENLLQAAGPPPPHPSCGDSSAAQNGSSAPQQASKDWIQQELVKLLLSYPGGVTEAILCTHLHKRIKQAGAEVPKAADPADRDSVPLHKVPGPSSAQHGSGAFLHADVVAVQHRKEPFADQTNTSGTSGQRGSAAAASALVLSQPESRAQGLLRLARRFQGLRLLPRHQEQQQRPGSEAATCQVGAGTKVRLANVRSFGTSVRKSSASGSSKKDPGKEEPPSEQVQLLPTQQMVVVRQRLQDELEQGQGVGDGWGEAHRAPLEPGVSLMLPLGVLGCVVAIGAETSCREGCGCVFCGQARQGRHRCVLVGPPEGFSGTGTPQLLPLLLYDDDVALAELLRVGEALLLQCPVARLLSECESGCILNEAELLCSGGLPGGGSGAESTQQGSRGEGCFARCLEVGPETRLSVATATPATEQRPNAADDPPAKRQRLAEGDEAASGLPLKGSSFAASQSSFSSSVMVGEVIAIHQGPSAAQGSSLGAGQQPKATLVTVTLRTKDGPTELRVVRDAGRVLPRSTPSPARGIFPGHTIIAFPVSSNEDGSYSFSHDGDGFFQSLSTLPGLLASPQIHRPYMPPGGLQQAVRHRDVCKVECVQQSDDSRGGCRSALGPILVRAELLDAHVRVRRVHSSCHRPITESSLMEGFFDDFDDDDDDSGSGNGTHDEASAAAPNSDGPISPSQLGANFRDGLWDCQFCNRECGSTEVSLQLVGFVLARDVSKSPGNTGSSHMTSPEPASSISAFGSEAMWMRADGVALECMTGMSAAQFSGMPKENRTRCIEEMLRRPMVLSLVPVETPETEPRLSFGGWSLDCSSKGPGTAHACGNGGLLQSDTPPATAASVMIASARHLPGP